MKRITCVVAAILLLIFVVRGVILPIVNHAGGGSSKDAETVNVQANTAGTSTDNSTEDASASSDSGSSDSSGDSSSDNSSTDATVMPVKGSAAADKLSVMTPGWHEDSTGKWYQNPDGTYYINGFAEIDGTTYSFDENGYMQTGWVEKGVKDYYFNEDGSYDPTQKRPMIALTFDDGPKAGVTDWLLDELEKRNVKVTFFLIGSQADLPENRETIRRMAEDGHQIGCHTYHHVQMTTLSENQQKQEILQWYQAVSSIIGDFSYAVRPPYGCVNNAVCRSLNVPVILWSVDTEDWTGKSAGEIADYVISEAKDGDIILLHDIFEESVQGAVMALDDLMRRGYTFVTVNDLLADRGIAIQSGKVYRQAAQGGK